MYKVRLSVSFNGFSFLWAKIFPGDSFPSRRKFLESGKVQSKISDKLRDFQGVD